MKVNERTEDERALNYTAVPI